MAVRLAFIGAGGIADWKHFDNLESLDGVEVVAICDVDEETAWSAGERFDADVYTDHEALYEEGAFDAVFVCLPPFAHEDQEILAAERGIDLFVEKPLALSNETARRIHDAVESAGIVAQAGHNWRYSSGVERAREILDGRELVYIDGWWWGGVPGDEDHWWRSKAHSGGQIVEQATHIYDAVRYLAGDVERVAAAGSTRRRDFLDFPDVTSATMTHENGVVSHVSATAAADEGNAGLEIVADGARIEVDQHRVEGVVDGESIEETFDADPYLREVESFVEAVRAGDDADVRSTYADATKSLALTLAATESAETGEPVTLD